MSDKDKNVKNILILNPYVPTLGGGEKLMGYLCAFMEDYYKKDLRIDILVFNYNDVDVNAENYITVADINRQFGLKLEHTYIRKLTEKKWIKQGGRDKCITALSAEYDLFFNFMIFSRHIGRAKTNIYMCMFPPKSYASEVGWRFWRYPLSRTKDHAFLESYQAFEIISDFTGVWLDRYWKKRKDQYMVYPPVFHEADIKGRYAEEEKKNIIISVGRFFVAAHSKKQLEMTQFFVKHQDIFSSYEYHLVGAVSNLPQDIAYLEQIKMLAGKVNNVFIHENCPYEELMRLYRQAKIFWHGTGFGVDENAEPEKMEHFGITTVEAMSFGAVPVVINKGGQKETVEQGVSGYRWDTEDECVEFTRQLIEDDNKRKQMAEVSSERANRYSIEEFYRQNRKLFNELKI